MKKLFLFIEIFTVLTLFINCKTTNIESSSAKQSENYFSDKIYFFSGKRPIVQIEINEIIFTFLIDTGSNYNLLSNKGIEKISRLLPDNTYNQIKEKVFSTITINGGKAGEIEFTLEYYDKNKEYDGILGTSFLQKKADVVTFDYKKKQIIFGKYPLEGKKEKLIPVSLTGLAPIYFMEIEMNNSKEYFIFDTGNETVTLRSKYDIEASYYPSEDFILSVIGGKHKKTNVLKKKKLPIFTYSSSSFEKITAVYNDYFRSKASPAARRILDYYCSAGYSLFKDKVIQINFADNSIIITE